MFKELRDKEQIASFLSAAPFLHAYELADLDDFFWPLTQWLAWIESSEVRAIFLLYSAVPQCPTLLALEESDLEASRLLAGKILSQLPDRLYGHLSFHLEEILHSEFLFPKRRVDLRMGIKAGKLRKPRTLKKVKVFQLGKKDLDRIEHLYEQAYPDNWFDPRMLETQHYLGLEFNGEFCAIAGVHVYSPAYGIAVLGNIATLPGFRGRGFGTFLTYELCRKLFDSVGLIGLNVRASNRAAIRCYERLGFGEHARFAEVKLIRRSEPRE